DVDVHFALCALLYFALELVDFRALASDDDARTRGVNPHDQFVRRALDIDAADAGRFQPVLQLLAQLDVFVQQVGVFLLREPARLPTLVVAQPKTVRMCFLTQNRLLLLLRFLRALLDSLAGFSDRTLHAFRGSFFGRRFLGAGLCGAYVLGHIHHDVAGPLLIPEAAAHRRRTHALPPRPFVHKTAGHEQLIDVERRAGIVRLALRIGDRAAQRLLDFLRHALLGETQRLQRIFGALAADQVDHQPRL